MSDGNIVYQGLACEAPDYFSKIGFQFSKFSNPADIFMKVLSVNYPKQSEDEEKLELLVNSYNKSIRGAVLIEMSKNKIQSPDRSELIRYSASLFT